MKNILSIVLFNLIAVALAHDFSLCHNQHTDALGVSSVIFSPDPPKSGQEVMVSVKGTPGIEIESGKVHVDIRVLGVTVESQVMELCQVVSCPLKVGQEYEGVVKQLIPEGTPSNMGATVRLTLIDEQGKSLTCLESYVQIGKLEEEQVFEEEEEEFALNTKDIMFLFNKWKLQFPKVIAKFETFEKNLLKIITHNQDESKTYKMIMNEFGSMTEEEFVQARMGYRQHENPSKFSSMKPQVLHDLNFYCIVQKVLQNDKIEKQLDQPQ